MKIQRTKDCHEAQKVNFQFAPWFVWQNSEIL